MVSTATVWMNSLSSMLGIEDYISSAGNYVTLFQALLDAIIAQIEDGTDVNICIYLFNHNTLRGVSKI